jgi:hypothetical protein
MPKIIANWFHDTSLAQKPAACPSLNPPTVSEIKYLDITLMISLGMSLPRAYIILDSLRKNIQAFGQLCCAINTIANQFPV